MTLFIPSLAGFSLLLRINYITFYLSLPFFSGYAFSLFPRQISKKVIQVICLASGLAALTPLVLPAATFLTALMPWMQYATIAAVAYAAVCVIRATLAKEPDAGIFMLGFFFFFAAIVNDVLYTRQFISTVHLTPGRALPFLSYARPLFWPADFPRAFSLVTRQQTNSR